MAKVGFEIGLTLCFLSFQLLVIFLCLVKSQHRAGDIFRHRVISLIKNTLIFQLHLHIQTDNGLPWLLGYSNFILSFDQPCRGEL